MPTIGEIQTCINNLTTASDAAEFAILATEATRATSNNLSFSVATVADLPDLYTANISNGQIVYVVSLGIPVVANKVLFEWKSMDGRLIRKDGVSSQLWTWGNNGYLQLGTNNVATVSRSSPGTTSGGGSTWCQSSAGRAHSAAVKTDGTLWTWGCNSSGQLGTNSVNPCGSPGTTAGGGTTWRTVGVGFAPLFAVAAHTAGVKTDGTLWTWGGNTNGRLGDGTVTNRSSPGTTAGPNCCTWCQISTGVTHTAGIKTDATLWTWGYNSNGQLGDGTITSRISPITTAGPNCCDWCQISTGNNNTTAVKTNGTLWTWGYNTFGQLGDGTVTRRSSPGTTAGPNCCDWCQVSGGDAHTSAVKTDGTLWTWGSNTAGRLGIGTTVNRSSPGTTAGGGTTWCHSSANGGMIAAVKTDGTLWTWGDNQEGKLGDGTVVARSSPATTAGGTTTWCTASAGFAHAMAISAC